MTGFDNGPRDGDFVRYIDELVTRNATKPIAAVDSPVEPPLPRPIARPAPTDVVVPATPQPAGPPSLEALAEGLARNVRRNGPKSAAMLVAFAIGLALVIAGLLGDAFDPVAFVIGIGLVGWAASQWKRFLREAAAAYGRRQP